MRYRRRPTHATPSSTTPLLPRSQSHAGPASKRDDRPTATKPPTAGNASSRARPSDLNLMVGEGRRGEAVGKGESSPSLPSPSALPYHVAVAGCQCGSKTANASPESKQKKQNKNKRKQQQVEEEEEEVIVSFSPRF
ncbi:hypothetical protein BHE74_00024846 [Ensete ventricosum]|nr:hypothetical protein BHE74_00024846 [Ensete ventricosum]